MSVPPDSMALEADIPAQGVSGTVMKRKTKDLTTTAPQGGHTMSARAQQVVELLKAIETRAQEPMRVINPAKYIQHNIGVADGPAGVVQLLKDLPRDSTRVNTVRVFEDGDFVVAHSEYNFFGPKIGFDVFRFEDGLIVEHWDNLQETAGPNPSGHTMIDGPTTPTDLDSTEANKALVRRLVDDILVNGRMELLAGYFDGDRQGLGAERCHARLGREGNLAQIRPRPQAPRTGQFRPYHQ